MKLATRVLQSKQSCSHILMTIVCGPGDGRVIQSTAPPLIVAATNQPIESWLDQ